MPKDPRFFSIFGITWMRQCVVSEMMKEVLPEELMLREMSWDWLRPLHVDYYYPNLNLVVEYNGANHYLPVRWYGIPNDRAEKTLERQKVADERKAKLLDEHGIKLLVLRWDEELTVDAIRKRIVDAVGDDDDKGATEERDHSCCCREAGMQGSGGGSGVWSDPPQK